MDSTPKTLTTEDVTKLLNEIGTDNTSAYKQKKAVRNYGLAVTMLDAGLRVGEVVQLQVADLFFVGNPVTTLVVRAEIAKNQHERIIPISARLSEAILKMKASYWPRLTEFGSWNAFTLNMNQKPMSTRSVERIIRKAAMAALGRPIHPHMLRHTFASRLMRVTNMRTVQELLGHKDITSTQIYTHPNGDDLKKAIDKLSQE